MRGTSRTPRCRRPAAASSRARQNTQSSTSLILVPAEVGGLVVLARTPLDLLLLCEESRALGIGSLPERAGLGCRLVACRGIGRDRLRRGPPPPAAGADDAP